MTEGNPLDGDVTHGMLCRADKLHQGLQYRNNGIADGLTFSRHVVELMLPDIMIPFARLVEQFLGICQIER